MAEKSRGRVIRKAASATTYLPGLEKSLPWKQRVTAQQPSPSDSYSREALGRPELARDPDILDWDLLFKYVFIGIVSTALVLGGGLGLYVWGTRDSARVVPPSVRDSALGGNPSALPDDLAPQAPPPSKPQP